MNDKLFELTISVEALKIHEIDGKVGTSVRPNYILVNIKKAAQ